MPRILIITKALNVGGTERHIERIVPILRQRGIDIEIWVLKRGGSLEADILNSGVAIYGLKPRHGRLLHLLLSAIALFRHLRQSRPDAVHFFLPEAYLVGAIAAALAGQKVSLMSRRSLANYQNRHPFLAGVERFLHRRTTALLGNSRAVVEQLAQEVASRAKIGLIYNGIEVPEQTDGRTPAELRRTFGIPADACVVVCVANLIPYKGHVDVVDAFGGIAGLLSQSWRLVLIGRDEGEGAMLAAKAASLGLSQNVLFLGERSDVGQILEMSDVGLLASHQEGFSNALLEMMAHGLAVVATAVGGNAEAIVDGQCGRLVPPRAPDALAAAVLDLMHDPDLRHRLGTAARRRATEQFSLETCIRRYETLYRNLLRLEREPVEAVLDEFRPVKKIPPHARAPDQEAAWARS